MKFETINDVSINIERTLCTYLEKKIKLRFSVSNRRNADEIRVVRACTTPFCLKISIGLLMYSTNLSPFIYYPCLGNNMEEPVN